jgi:hypothetical protein
VSRALKIKMGFLWDVIPCNLVEVHLELRKSSEYGRVRGQHDTEDSPFQNSVPTNAKTTGNNKILKQNRECVCIIYVIVYKENEFLKYNLNECSGVILCIIRDMI